MSMFRDPDADHDVKFKNPVFRPRSKSQEINELDNLKTRHSSVL